MKFHIVSNNETIKEIISIYNITFDELRENNKHIRDINKVLPGTKLKIPTITEVIDQDIMEMEPFIEDYYPRKPIVEETSDINIIEEKEAVKEEIIEKEKGTSLEEKELINDVSEETKEIKKETKEEISSSEEVRKEESKKQDINKNEKKQDNIVYVPVYYPTFIYIPIYLKDN